MQTAGSCWLRNYRAVDYLYFGVVVASSTVLFSNCGNLVVVTQHHVPMLVRAGQ